MSELLMKESLNREINILKDQLFNCYERTNVEKDRWKRSNRWWCGSTPYLIYAGWLDRKPDETCDLQIARRLA